MGNDTNVQIIVELKGQSSGIDEVFNLVTQKAQQTGVAISNAFSVAPTTAIENLQKIGRAKDELIKNFGLLQATIRDTYSISAQPLIDNIRNLKRELESIKGNVASSTATRRGSAKADLSALPEKSEVKVDFVWNGQGYERVESKIKEGYERIDQIRKQYEGKSIKGVQDLTAKERQILGSERSKQAQIDKLAREEELKQVRNDALARGRETSRRNEAEKQAELKHKEDLSAIRSAAGKEFYKQSQALIRDTETYQKVASNMYQSLARQSDLHVQREAINTRKLIENSKVLTDQAFYQQKSADAGLRNQRQNNRPVAQKITEDYIGPAMTSGLNAASFGADVVRASFDKLSAKVIDTYSTIKAGGVTAFDSLKSGFTTASTKVGGFFSGLKNTTTEGLSAFRTKFGEMSGHVTEVANDSKSRFGEIFSANFFAGVAYNAVFSFIGAIRDIAKETVVYAARTQELGVVLATLANHNNIATSAISEQEEAIKRLNITTQDARETLARFINVGFDIKAAAPLARVAQDLAVISGVTSSEELNKLIIGIQTLQSRNLRNAGVFITVDETLDKLAVTTNRARDSFSTLEKQQAVLNAVMEYGAKAAGTYEAAMGTASKQLRSLDRIFKEAQNSIGEAFVPALLAGVEASTKLLGWITQYPGAFQGAIGVVLALTAALVALKTQAIQGAITGLSTSALGIVGYDTGINKQISDLKAKKAALQKEATTLVKSQSEVEIGAGAYKQRANDLTVTRQRLIEEKALTLEKQKQVNLDARIDRLSNKIKNNELIAQELLLEKAKTQEKIKQNSANIRQTGIQTFGASAANFIGKALGAIFIAAVVLELGKIAYDLYNAPIEVKPVDVNLAKEYQKQLDDVTRLQTEVKKVYEGDGARVLLLEGAANARELELSYAKKLHETGLLRLNGLKSERDIQGSIVDAVRAEKDAIEAKIKAQQAVAGANVFGSFKNLAKYSANQISTTTRLNVLDDIQKDLKDKGGVGYGTEEVPTRSGLLGYLQDKPNAARLSVEQLTDKYKNLVETVNARTDLSPNEKIFTINNEVKEVEKGIAELSSNLAENSEDYKKYKEKAIASLNELIQVQETYGIDVEGTVEKQILALGVQTQGARELSDAWIAAKEAKAKYYGDKIESKVSTPETIFKSLNERLFDITRTRTEDAKTNILKNVRDYKANNRPEKIEQEYGLDEATIVPLLNNLDLSKGKIADQKALTEAITNTVGEGTKLFNVLDEARESAKETFRTNKENQQLFLQGLANNLNAANINPSQDPVKFAEAYNDAVTKYRSENGDFNALESLFGDERIQESIFKGVQQLFDLTNIGAINAKQQVAKLKLGALLGLDSEKRDKFLDAEDSDQKYGRVSTIQGLVYKLKGTTKGYDFSKLNDATFAEEEIKRLQKEEQITNSIRDARLRLKELREGPNKELDGLQRQVKIEEAIYKFKNNYKDVEDEISILKVTSTLPAVNAQLLAEKAILQTIQDRRQEEQQLTADIAVEIAKRTRFSLGSQGERNKLSAEVFLGTQRDERTQQEEALKNIYGLQLELGGDTKAFTDNPLIKEAVRQSEHLAEVEKKGGLQVVKIEEGNKIAQLTADNTRKGTEQLTALNQNFPTFVQSVQQAISNIPQQSIGGLPSSDFTGSTPNQFSSIFAARFKQAGIQTHGLNWLMANLERESSFNLSATQRGVTDINGQVNYGGFQWQRDRRRNEKGTGYENFLSTRGVTKETARAQDQADFAVFELEKRFPGLLNILRNPNTSNEQAYTAVQKYIGFSDSTTKRAPNGQTWREVNRNKNIKFFEKQQGRKANLSPTQNVESQIKSELGIKPTETKELLGAKFGFTPQEAVKILQDYAASKNLLAKDGKAFLLNVEQINEALGEASLQRAAEGNFSKDVTDRLKKLKIDEASYAVNQKSENIALVKDLELREAITKYKLESQQEILFGSSRRATENVITSQKLQGIKGGDYQRDATLQEARNSRLQQELELEKQLLKTEEELYYRREEGPRRAVIEEKKYNEEKLKGYFELQDSLDAAEREAIYSKTVQAQQQRELQAYTERLTAATTLYNELKKLETDYTQGYLFSAENRARVTNEHTKSIYERYNAIINEALVLEEKHKNAIGEKFLSSKELALNYLKVQDAINDSNKRNTEAIKRQQTAEAEIADGNVVNYEEFRANVLEHLKQTKSATQIQTELWTDSFESIKGGFASLIDNTTGKIGKFKDILTGFVRNIFGNFLKNSFNLVFKNIFSDLFSSLNPKSAQTKQAKLDAQTLTEGSSTTLNGEEAKKKAEELLGTVPDATQRVITEFNALADRTATLFAQPNGGAIEPIPSLDPKFGGIRAYEASNGDPKFGGAIAVTEAQGQAIQSGTNNVIDSYNGVIVANNTTASSALKLSADLATSGSNMLTAAVAFSTGLNNVAAAFPTATGGGAGGGGIGLTPSTTSPITAASPSLNALSTLSTPTAPQITQVIAPINSGQTVSGSGGTGTILAGQTANLVSNSLPTGILGGIAKGPTNSILKGLLSGQGLGKTFKGVGGSLLNSAPLLGAGLGGLLGGNSAGGQILGQIGGLLGGVAGLGLAGLLSGGAIGASLFGTSALVATGVHGATAVTSVGGLLGSGGALGGLGAVFGGIGSSFGLAGSAAIAAGAALVLAPIAIGLLVGAKLLARNKLRRQEETQRSAFLGDAKKQLLELLSNIRKDRIDGDDAITQAAAIRDQYLQASNGLKDKKTRRIAVETVRELDTIIVQIKAAAKAQQIRRETDLKIAPTYATGGIGGGLIRVSQGETLIHPDVASQLDMSDSGIPGYAKGGSFKQFLIDHNLKGGGFKKLAYYFAWRRKQKNLQTSLMSPQGKGIVTLPGSFDRKDNIYATVPSGTVIATPSQMDKVRKRNELPRFATGGIYNPYTNYQQPVGYATGGVQGMVSAPAAQAVTINPAPPVNVIIAIGEEEADKLGQLIPNARFVDQIRHDVKKNKLGGLAGDIVNAIQGY